MLKTILFSIITLLCSYRNIASSTEINITEALLSERKKNKKQELYIFFRNESNETIQGGFFNIIINNEEYSAKIFSKVGSELRFRYPIRPQKIGAFLVDHNISAWSHCDKIKVELKNIESLHWKNNNRPTKQMLIKAELRVQDLYYSSTCSHYKETKKTTPQ